MQNNDPRCPYCGNKMRSFASSFYYYECKNCKSHSPIKCRQNEAYEAAICRAPMSDFELIEAIKRNPRAELKLEAPLTIEEARVYLREYGDPVWVQKTKKDAGYWLLAQNASRMLDVSEESYGKTYEFWKKPPKNEELDQAERDRQEKSFEALVEKFT